MATIALATCIDCFENPLLVRNFLQFYEKLGVVRKAVILHMVAATGCAKNEVFRECVSAGCSIEQMWVGPFSDIEKMHRLAAMRSSSRDPERWWITVDVDEFLELELSELHSLIKSPADYVRGELIDRIAPEGAFAEIPETQSMDSVFPLKSRFSRDCLAAYTIKIPIARATVQQGLGQHTVSNTFRPACTVNSAPIAINHFKWSRDCIGRIQRRLASPLPNPVHPWQLHWIEEMKTVATFLTNTTPPCLDLTRIRTWS